MSSGLAGSFFESCRSAGDIATRFGVMNEEAGDHPVIMLCRGPRGSWQEFWQGLQEFG